MFRQPFHRLILSSKIRPPTTKRTFQHTTDGSSTSKIKGKKIIVTGASRGIGRAIAERYAYDGAQKVILVGRHEETLRNITCEINKATEGYNDGKHEYRVGDVIDRRFWQELGKEM
ncbi:MAG: hypothetical protein M1830_000618, partial [Pleopsidium flavum]